MSKLTWESKEERINVVNQFEVLRRNGSNNMFDFYAVQKEAFDVGLFDFVNFFENESNKYVKFLGEFGGYQEFIDEDMVEDLLELF